MLKNVTITLPENVAHWARRKAADQNLSMSRLIGKILESQMRQGDEYWKAYRQWKELGTLDIDAEHRMSREETHARR